MQDAEVQTFRLRCSAFWVDVRLLEVDGRWMASAETVDGPTSDARGVVGELLASLPADGG